MYDEIHDAKPWALFNLSYDIYEAQEGADLMLYIITATPDSPIAVAVREAMHRSLPGWVLDRVNVTAPPGQATAQQEATPHVSPPGRRQPVECEQPHRNDRTRTSLQR